MYLNKNYEWMTDWEKPSWFLSECLYWVRLYHKIMEQGTAEDKVKLKETYDRSKARFRDENGWSIFGFIARIFAGAEHYAYACEWFIHDTKMAALNDDDARMRDIRMNYESPELIAAKKRLYGEDYQTRDLDNARLEKELTAKHTIKQKTFKKNMQGLHIHPTLEEAKRQKIAKSGEQYIDTNKGRIAVHYRIYDKCQGFYTAIVWADNRPLLPDGSMPVRADFSAKFTGTAGIIEIVESMIRAERIEAVCGFK